jgi:peptide/nickel transport system substrate-binding protein
VFYGSKGPNNGMGYSNPELDAVLDKVEHTMADADRKALFKEMQRIIATDIPVVPTTSNVNLIAVTKKLKNFVANPTNRTDFIDTSRWYLEP